MRVFYHSFTTYKVILQYKYLRKSKIFYPPHQGMEFTSKFGAITLMASTTLTKFVVLNSDFK